MLNVMTCIGVTTDEDFEKCCMRVKKSFIDVRTGEKLAMC